MKNRLIIKIDLPTLTKILSDETGEHVKQVNFLTDNKGAIQTLELELDKKKTIKE